VIFIVAMFLFPTYSVSATRYNVSDGNWKYGSEDITGSGRVWNWYDTGQWCESETYNDEIFMDYNMGFGIKYFEIAPYLNEGNWTTYQLGAGSWIWYSSSTNHGATYYQTYSEYHASINGHTYVVGESFTSNHAQEEGAFSVDIIYKTGGDGSKYWRFSTYIKPEVTSDSQKVEMWDIIDQDPTDNWNNVYAELSVGDKGHRDSSYTSANGEQYGFIRVNAPSSNEDMLIGNTYNSADSWYWTVQKDQSNDPRNPVWSNTGENPYNNGDVAIWAQSVKYTSDCYTAATCTKVIGLLDNY
jgi:hypothetical protein